jgi:glycosyltransferase involved in cell wall biosynthesis
MGLCRGSVKHVLFAHRKLSFGGGERVLIEQVAALADLPVKVSILYRKEPGRRDIEPELRDRNPNVGQVLHAPGPIASFSWLRRHRPDLLVLCNHKGVQRALPWLARFGTRIPTVVTLHEHYDRHLRKYKGIRDLVDRWIITWAFEDAVRRCLGPQPCPIIHPLYPRPEATPPGPGEKAEARAALGIPRDALLVGYAGQLDERKDPVRILRLAERLEAYLGRPLHLLFAGRESAGTAKELDSAVAASALGPRIHRLGALPSIRPAFLALDAYLMTSRNEGFFPLALLEAMERGVPLIVPTVGGISSQLRDGDGGFLMVKPDDRGPVPDDLLDRTAARVAPLLGDPEAWAVQRERSVAFARRMLAGYDAAALFRDAVAPWLP